MFSKRYAPNWSEEIFRVKERIKRALPVYRITDLNNELIIGTFYEPELQKVTLRDDLFSVDKVLKERTRKGKKEYFVRWAGYPSSFDSWVAELL